MQDAGDGTGLERGQNPRDEARPVKVDTSQVPESTDYSRAVSRFGTPGQKGTSFTPITGV